MKNLPGLVVIWGSNLMETSGPHAREWLRAALLNGAKLVVVDPKRIDIAKRADLWIRVRPGSDGALALGIIKVIIEEELYDRDFVEKWTIGFDELRQHVKTFTIDDVERVTWVPRQQIETFARMCAHLKPMNIHPGNVFSHSSSFQPMRALLILNAITGPQNIPGWGIKSTPAAYTRPGRLMLLSKYPRKPENTLGGRYGWAMRTAYIPYQALTKGILEEKPYPVKAALVIISNPLSSYPNAREAYEAFRKLEFLVVLDLFMTPTAAIADIVLPVATSGEYDAIGYWGGGVPRAFPKLVDPPGEAWPDTKIINQLGIRLGLTEDFFDNEQAVLEHFMESSGLTWEDFKHKRLLAPMRVYQEPGDTPFRTPSGKVEIVSKQMKDVFNSNKMPLWEEVSRLPLGQPSQEYPLLLTTRCEAAYKLTAFKHVRYMRKQMPNPIVEMNPMTAQTAGLKEGEWVYIETKNGRIMHKLSLDADLDPKVVLAAFGWWFPEDTSNLYQWDKANINILFGNDIEEPATGAVELRGIPCRVYKVGKQ